MRFVLVKHWWWVAIPFAAASGCTLEAQPADPVPAGAAGTAGVGGGGDAGSGGSGGRTTTGSGGAQGGSGGTAGDNPGEGGMGATIGTDPCDPSPCGHGTCSANGDDYTCSCTDGYTGDHCELEVNECATSPCEHGTCLDRAGTYECDCGTTGYTGEHCETLIQSCEETPCDNGGTCIDGDGARTCDCTGTGATGESCEVDIDECAMMYRCAKGTCVNGKNTFTCDCTGTGYTGPDCTTDVNECDDDPCDPLTVCHNVDGGFSCSDCPQGYTGNGLSGCRDIDECATNNGGCGPADCTNVPGGRMCGACPTGYYVLNGDCVDDDECTTYPCSNGGTCQNIPGSFVCSCAAPWTGNNCRKATLRIDARARGYYTDNPSYPPNGAAFVGYCGTCSGVSFRAFYVFPIPVFVGTVSSVSFIVEHTEYDSIDATETFTVHEATDTPTLVALGGTPEYVYEDLGDGTWFGSFILSSQTVGQISTTTLSGATAKLSLARGGDFAIGISQSSYSGQTSAEEWAKFSTGIEPRTEQLQINVVP